MLDTFAALVHGLGGLFEPVATGPKKDRKAPRSILPTARPLTGQHYRVVHGTIYSKLRAFHREHGIHGKKQRRIARGNTNKLNGPRAGRIRKWMELERQVCS